jgi:hypothetical protein
MMQCRGWASVVESGDRTPPSQAVLIFSQMRAAAEKQIAAWLQYKTHDLQRLNETLKRANHKSLEMAAIEEQVHYAMTR